MTVPLKGIQFKLFCNFLKKAPDYIDPLGHFVFYNCRKVKSLRHLEINHPVFAVNLPVIFIPLCCRKQNLIQPPGEPRELNLFNFNMNVEIDIHM